MKRKDKAKKMEENELNYDEIMKRIDSAIKKFNAPENKRKTEMLEKRIHNLTPQDLLTRMTI
jgi:hypothetical protein